MTLLLTEVQRHVYERDGLVFPVQVLSQSEVRRFRTASDELEEQLGGKPRTIEVRQMHLHLCWAHELATHPRVLGAVQELLGANLLLWTTELFAKHPHDESVSIGWHRDRPYMGFEAGSTATAWIALSDSTTANGCMRAIPGPGRDLVPTPDRSSDGVSRKPTGPVDDDRVVDVLLRAGEMSLHDADILHGSNPNRSSEKRVGFVVRFITPEAQPLHGRPPVILARGSSKGDHFHIVDPPVPGDGTQAIEGIKQSAAQHFEAMIRNLKRTGL